MIRSAAEIREAAWWAIRVALAKELRDEPREPLLGTPRDIPFTWRPDTQRRNDHGRPVVSVQTLPQAAE